MPPSKKIEEFDLLEIQTLSASSTLAQAKLDYFIDYLKRKNSIDSDEVLDINTGKITLPEKKKDG